jgi:DNA damage-inducible protein 1
MRLLDTRFSGIARGVGTAKIMGRIHSAPMQVAGLHLGCAYTVMEGRDVDLLFGLDMLKAHQAIIDLEKGCLRIRGREVRFLAEHELPAKAKAFELPSDAPGIASTAQPDAAGSGAPGPSHFPGSGNTLGAPPMHAPAPPPSHAGATQGGSRHPETAIATLMGLGATREVAIQSLDAANGNLDIAASLLF